MFEFDEEQRLTRKNIHDFAKKELAPQAAYWDASEEFPWESVKKAAFLLRRIDRGSIFSGFKVLAGEAPNEGTSLLTRLPFRSRISSEKRIKRFPS